MHTKTASICPFEELCDFGVVVQKLGALTFVDEANAVGLNGKEGAGVGAEESIQEKIDIIHGTMDRIGG